MKDMVCTVQCTLENLSPALTSTALVDTTPEDEDKATQAPDVFAIGFEEIVDLNATNIVQNTQWSENAASWGKELQKVMSFIP